MLWISLKKLQSTSTPPNSNPLVTPNLAHLLGAVDRVGEYSRTEWNRTRAVNGDVVNVTGLAAGTEVTPVLRRGATLFVQLAHA